MSDIVLTLITKDRQGDFDEILNQIVPSADWDVLAEGKAAQTTLSQALDAGQIDELRSKFTADIFMRMRAIQKGKMHPARRNLRQGQTRVTLNKGHVILGQIRPG